MLFGERFCPQDCLSRREAAHDGPCSRWTAVSEKALAVEDATAVPMGVAQKILPPRERAQSIPDVGILVLGRVFRAYE